MRVSDLMRREVATDMRVRDWMTPDPQTIRQDATLQQARDLMDGGGFRHLPVKDARGTLVGILTDRDIREHHGHLTDTRVTAAALEEPFTVGPDAPIEAAAELLLRWKIGSLPVVDVDGDLVGIITETDLLRGFLGRESRQTDGRSYIDVQLVAPSQTLSEAVGILEGAQCTVFGARTMDDPGCVRTFRLHLEDEPARAADVLRTRGYAVRAIHPVDVTD